MGTCFLHGNGGGGNALIFRVYACTALPATAKENDVAVITSTPIKWWVVYSRVPTWESVEGHVYLIDTPTTSGEYPNVNIIKPNKTGGAILMQLIGCYQYISGQWHSMDAYQYRSGQWVQLHPNSEYVIKDGVIDMTAHPATITENSEYSYPATNGGTYNNKPALQMPGCNGAYCTHSFANVAVPAWATVFSVEIYYIPAYDGDPSINIGGASVTISRGSSDRIIDKTVSIDVSSISGNTGNLSFRFQGCAYNDVCYIGNAWFA